MRTNFKTMEEILWNHMKKCKNVIVVSDLAKMLYMFLDKENARYH